jgi:hypothetical protein
VRRSLAELMSYIFNAVASTERMSKTGLEPKKSSENNLSWNQRKRNRPRAFVTSVIDVGKQVTRNVVGSGTAARETPMAETIKSGITRIEEGPDSVGFASEPWTSFYMAGETIRKLRQATEKKARREAEAPEQREDNRLDV